MKTHAPLIVVTIAFAALICCGHAISLSLGRPDPNTADTFATGQTSPEGAACDLMRAYITRNAALFHERRCKQYCEGWANPAIAYDQFLQYKPQPLSEQSTNLAQRDRPTKIAAVRPAECFPMSEDEAQSKRLELLLNHGAYESKFVDIITSTDNDQRYITRVETLHVCHWSEDEEKLLPTGTWRARIMDHDHLQDSHIMGSTGAAVDAGSESKRR